MSLTKRSSPNDVSSCLMVFCHDFGIAEYEARTLSISPELSNAVRIATAWDRSFSALALRFRRFAMISLCSAKSAGWGTVIMISLNSIWIGLLVSMSMNLRAWALMPSSSMGYGLSDSFPRAGTRNSRIRSGCWKMMYPYSPL